MTIDLGTPRVIGPSMRRAVKELVMGEVAVEEFYWDKYILTGAYGIWEIIEDEWLDNEGAMPPIGYKDGEAL